MDVSDSARELITIEQYLTLSAKLNYQLSAKKLNKHVLLSLVLGRAELNERDHDILIQAFNTLQAGYQLERRRLGTPGILHPLRAAAILSRTMDKPTVMHLLGALLHDKDEDLTESELGKERFDLMKVEYDKLLQLLTPEEQIQLQLRIDALSNQVGNYQSYLGTLMDAALEMPDLLHVKLSDRLDNTFDIHLQHPGVTHFNFYRAVFDILFLPGFKGVEMGKFHFMPETSEGVMLLSQLFKDTILLAMIRSHGLDRQDGPTRRLFVGLAVAGIREAQWLALEMFNTCYSDVAKQRELLKRVMEYCASGGINTVTSKEAGSSLDGIFLQAFTAGKAGAGKKMLTELFDDREQLASMTLAFIVIFASFINDPEYTLQGIDRSGTTAVDSSRSPA